MSASDKKLVFLNLFWGIITGTLSYFINFILTPIITNRLGIEAYGFVQLGNQVIAYVNIISVGLNSFSARYIGEEYHKKNYKSANSFYSSIMGANIILSIIVLGLTVVMLSHMEALINVPEDLSTDVKILFLILAVNYILGQIGSVFSSIAFLKNKISGTSKIKGVSVLIYVLLILFIVHFTKLKVYYVTLANIVASVIILCGNMVYAKYEAPELHIKLSEFDFSKVKKLLSAGIYNSINSLGGTLGSGLDLLITNILLSVTTMGQIAVGNQIGGILNTIITLVANAFQPKQLEAYTKGRTDEALKWMEASMKFCSIISLVFWGCFVFFGKNFYILWIPEQDIGLIYNISLIVIIGNLIVAIITPLYYVTTLTIRMKFVCFITLICGLTNVVSMLILLKIYQANAYVVVGTTAVLDIVSLIVFPMITKKYLQVKITNIVLLICKHFFAAVLFLVLHIFVQIPVSYYATNWIKFFMYIMVGGIIFLIASSIIMLNYKERSQIIQIVKNKIRHIF